MKVKMIAKSDVGKVREINEDFCGVYEDNKLAILCDGMGGHKAGAKASRLAVSTIRYMYIFLDQEKHLKITTDLEDVHKDLAARLVSSVRLANCYIYNKARKENLYKGMGTTVSALAFIDGIACICHVGDSRIYRFREEEMELLTEDHSWVNELIQDNEIDKEEASQFEKKNVITRALGLAPTVKIDLILEPTKTSDLFLLCSDGLTKGLSDDKIKNIVLCHKNDLDEALTQLIDAANDADGSDNVTVSLAKIEKIDCCDRILLPESITLKPESHTINSLENKILKAEFSKKDLIDRNVNKVNLFSERKYSKIFVILALSLITIFFVKYSITDHKSDNTIESMEAISKEESKNLTNNVISNPNDTTTNTNIQINSPLINNVNGSISNDSLNKSITRNEKIYTRPLNKASRNQGLIYLVGMENLANNKKTFLFLNRRLLGNTVEFFETGIRVRPGKYEISIKDSNKTILYMHNDIWISAGDIKAIELRPTPQWLNKLRTTSKNH